MKWGTQSIFWMIKEVLAFKRFVDPIKFVNSWPGKSSAELIDYDFLPGKPVASFSEDFTLVRFHLTKLKFNSRTNTDKGVLVLRKASCKIL